MSSAAFHDIQYKASSGQVNLDQAQGIVECFVAGIGNKDSVGDVCATGAFTKSLMRRKPRVVWGHNWNDPIGKVIEIYEVPTSDPRLPAKMKAAGIGGLYAKVQFNLNSEKGREAFANVAFFGEEQEWSIGYKTLRAQFDPGIQANILYEVELYEVSPVLHGANQLTGTISVKSDEKGGMMPMVVSPVGRPSDDETEMEDEMQRKLEEELSARLGAPVKVLKTEDGMVYFSRNDSEGEESKYKCRYHRGNDGVFMFGRPERFMMPKPMPMQMPMAIQKPQPGMPSKPMASTPGAPPVVVPSLVPGATPVSPPMVRFNYEGEAPAMSTPGSKPKLVDEERDLAEALIKITKRYGKFNEDSTGVWAGYKPAAENPVAKIGVKCSNCVLYEGNGKCKIVAQSVEPEGKCRFAVIPDGVVTMGPVQKASYDSESNEEEVKWLEEIEQKYPGEFVSGILRGTLKRRRKRRMGSKTVFMLNEYSEKSLEDFADFNMSEAAYVLPVNPERAFEVKQLIDPIIDFHRVDAYVEDGGIIFTNGVTRDFVAAVGAAVNDPFFQSEKALGRNLAGKFQRGRGLAARFDPYAWDGDNDGIVQEGTAFERPAIPGVNDFASRGKINRRAARQIEKQWNSQRSEGREQRVTAQEAKPETPSVEGLQSGRSANPTARKLDEIINSHDDKWDLDKTDQDFSDYLAELDPDETLDALAEIQQQARIDKAQATEAGVLEDDVTGDDFGSIVKRLMADYDMDEFDAEEEGARLLDAYDEYRRRREHYLTASNAVKRRMRGSENLRSRKKRDGLSSGREDISPEDQEKIDSLNRDLEKAGLSDRMVVMGLPSEKDQEARLRDRDRDIYMRRTVYGETLEEVAEDTGMSRQEVRQAEMRHSSRMRSMEGDELNEEVYELRQEASSLEDAARAFGKTREEIRKAELNHLKRIRSLPQDEKDKAITRDMAGASLNGRPLSLKEVATKYGVTEEEARRSQLRQLRKEREASSLSRREIRRRRIEKQRPDEEAGSIDASTYGGVILQKKDDFSIGSSKQVREGLASGASPSDDAPMEEWDAYFEQLQREREERGPRPRGEALYGPFVEDLAKGPASGDEKRYIADVGWDGAVFLSYDKNPGYLDYDLVDPQNFDKPRISYDDSNGIIATKPGWYMARMVFDDYEGYYSDEVDYDFGYAIGPFDDAESAAKFWTDKGLDRDNMYRGRSEGLSSGAKYPERYESSKKLADLMNAGPRPKRSKYDYSPDGQYDPTEEQKDIIDAVMEGADVVVGALAGSGKTSTLVSLAKRLKKEKPGQKSLYLAFNKTAGKDASRRFRGTGVKVMTLDGLTFNWYKKGSKEGAQHIKARFTLNKNATGTPVLSKDIARKFRIGTIENGMIGGADGASSVSGEDIARLAIDAVREYEISADRQIGLQHIVKRSGAKTEPIEGYSDEVMAAVVDAAKKIWQSKTDASDPDGVQLSNATITKMFALEAPDLKEASGVAVDLAMFDESQDLNPVWSAYAKAQKIQTVVVGDPNQAIYGFRGAKNEMDVLGAEKAQYVLPLTEVFRFGEEIAGPGNRVLALFGIGKGRMKGMGGRGSVVEPNSMENPSMVLARTNGGVIREAIAELAKGRVVGTTERAYNELDSFVETLKFFRGWRKNRPSNFHPDFQEFENWKEVEKAVGDDTAPPRVKMLFKVAMDFDVSELDELLGKLRIWKQDGDESDIDLDMPEDVSTGSSGIFADAGYEITNSGIVFNDNTYEVKNYLKVAGARWNADNESWTISAATDAEREEAFEKIVDAMENGFNLDIIPDSPSSAKSGSFGDTKTSWEISGGKIIIKNKPFMRRGSAEDDMLRNAGWRNVKVGKTARGKDIWQMELSVSNDDETNKAVLELAGRAFGVILDPFSSRMAEASDEEIVQGALKRIASLGNSEDNQKTKDIVNNIVESYRNKGYLKPKSWKILEARAGKRRLEIPIDVKVITAHLAKGLEDDDVKLAGDFWGPKLKPGSDKLEWPDQEHMNAIYVALTRAKKRLDPGSASWIYDFTDDDDEMPNDPDFDGGLSSGARKPKDKSNRRPWSDEDRQRFADRDILRAKTRPGKRRQGPSADEYRGLSSGASSDEDFSDDEEEETLDDVAMRIFSDAENAVKQDGIDLEEYLEIAISSELSKEENTFTEEAIREAVKQTRNDTKKNVKNRLKRRTGSKDNKPEYGLGEVRTNRKGQSFFVASVGLKKRFIGGKTKGSADIGLGTMSENETRKPGEKWMVPAAKFRELFKDINGVQLDDEQIEDLLSLKPGEIKKWDEPGAAIPESYASEIAELADSKTRAGITFDEFYGLDVPMDVIRIWGFDAAPRWVDTRTNREINREDFDINDIGKGKILPDNESDLLEYDEFSEARSGQQARSAGEARKASSRSQYPATKLARSLGVLGKDEDFDDDSINKFVAKLNELGINVSESTVSKTWMNRAEAGVPFADLQKLEKDGHIKISEVYPEARRADFVSKIDAIQSVVEKLEKAGLSERQIGSIINNWEGKGNEKRNTLSRHRENIAKGAKPRPGAAGQYTRDQFAPLIAEANAIIKKKGYNVPELSVNDVFDGPSAPSGPGSSASSSRTIPGTKYVKMKKNERGIPDFSGMDTRQIQEQIDERRAMIDDAQSRLSSLPPDARRKALGAINALEAEIKQHEGALRARKAAEQKRAAENRVKMPQRRRIVLAEDLDEGRTIRSNDAISVMEESGLVSEAPEIRARKEKESSLPTAPKNSDTQKNSGGRTKGARAALNKRLVS